MVTSQDSAVLLAIARAGVVEDGWPGMLQALQAATQAHAMRFWLPGGCWDAQGAVDHPLPPALAGLRLRRVYTGAELAERAPGLCSADDARGLGVSGPHGPGWLLLTGATFQARDSALLSSLVPHLEQAVEMAAQVQALRREAAQMQALARRTGAGYVQFGPRGEIAAADPVARALLARARGQGGIAQGVVTLGNGVEMLRLGDTGYLRATDQPLPTPEVLARHLGLALPEARLARALGHGASLREAAAILGLTLETARHYSKQIYAKTGLRGQPDLIRRLWTGVIPLG
ncbi:MAG: hypothetical protein JJU09_03810 [Rhodobacteraceae bacterium]|nr:hypothetical protein [Paracoccaceae bacterium]